MRRFLYLNSDSLYSYISQIDNGLIVGIVDEIGKNEAKTKEKETEIDADINADLKLLSKGLGAKVNSRIKQSNIENVVDEYKKSINKKIHDEAFEKFNKHINDKNLLKTNDLSIGDFVKINDEMFIVDLEYYKNIFFDNNILDLIKQDDFSKRLEASLKDIEVTGNGNKSSYEKEKLEKEIKKVVDLEYNEIRKRIDVVLNIIPYNKFGIMKDNLIVLDDDYFRDKTKVVAYKYGGKMEMLGYLTNIVDMSLSQDNENIFMIFPSIINSFLLNFFNQSRINIIHPIAIYYE